MLGQELIKVDKVSKIFFDGRREARALGEVTFTVNEGEFVTLFGPNGSGKTTLLNIIANLETPTVGSITYTKSNPKIGYVFQNYDESLLPWRTVEKNLRLPLENNLHSEQEISAQVDKIISLLNLNTYRQKYPYQLSGGKKQLTALGRALVIEPDLLLMDEPFSSLDFDTTIEMEQWIMNVWKKLNITILFVSHDIDEAILLADRLLVLSHKGVIENVVVQLDRPRNHDMVLSSAFVEIKKGVIAKYGRT